MSIWEPGDVVRLKSGGAPMTIEAAPPGEWVRAVWFDDDGQLQRGSFPEELLETATRRRPL